MKIQLYAQNTTITLKKYEWQHFQAWKFLWPVWISGSETLITLFTTQILVPSVCKPARTRWINKVILKVIYHTRIGSVIINFLRESIRGGAERNGSMRCNKLTLITSLWFAQIAYLAIQIIFKFIVAKQIFKDICIIRRYRVIYCAAYH